jgi:CHAD domain-containing protein
MSSRIALLDAEVRRIARLEIDAALGHLEGAHGETDKALHECRKRLKSLRGLLQLIRSGDEPFARAENARYRDAAKLLAGPREAAALLETLDRLEQEFPKKTAGGALDAIRDRFAARRRDALEHDLVHSIAAAAVACRTGLRRFERLALPEDAEGAADILRSGVRKAIRRARKALGKASKRGSADDFHDLRKAAKVYYWHLSLLRKQWPTPVKAHRKSIDELTERLGDLHDVFVLRKLLADEASSLGGRAGIEILDRLARKSERKLRKTCLAKASRILPASAKGTARRLARKIRQSEGVSLRKAA